MSDCTPECLTGDPDTMSSQCVRSLQEENKQLKADADRVAAACNVEMADLRTRWNAAEARIDAALAEIVGHRNSGERNPSLILRSIELALKGEK